MVNAKELIKTRFFYINKELSRIQEDIQALKMQEQKYKEELKLILERAEKREAKKIKVVKFKTIIPDKCMNCQCYEYHTGIPRCLLLSTTTKIKFIDRPDLKLKDCPLVGED